MPPKQNIEDLDQNLKRLSQIADWFENQKEVDVEEGLRKVKEAAELIKSSKKRLSDVENEFEEVKKTVIGVIDDEQSDKDENSEENGEENDGKSKPNINIEEIPF